MSTANNSTCIVSRRVLSEGRSAGLEQIEISNGILKISILPQRGMGIWKAWLAANEFGWQSPVKGPVHPALVPLYDPSGLGWLEGFDELLCRCGLLSNGAPDFHDIGTLKYPLHGRIANLPAENIQVFYDEATGSVSVSGDIHESRFHFHQLLLRSTVTMRPGRATFEVCDEVINLSAKPIDIQLMYHYNIGQPIMGGGAEVVAAVKKLVPRDMRSTQSLETWNQLDAPAASYTEQVYFTELYAGDDGSTQVLLKDESNTIGTSIHFKPSQLPYFVFWKNSVDTKDGFVCGIEPSTNFPNTRSFEGQHGRVINLTANQSTRFELTFCFHQGKDELHQVSEQIRALVKDRTVEICPNPTEDWCISV